MSCAHGQLDTPYVIYIAFRAALTADFKLVCDLQLDDWSKEGWHALG